jgi:hypothetical protein
MATSTSRLSYQDCYDILDKALENQKGIMFKVSDFGAGNHLRVRLHSARTIDREDNRVVYPPDHKLHGRSVYDPLVIRLRQLTKDEWTMYIERFNIEALDIKPLGEEHVLNETANSNLRETSAEGGGEPRSEAGEAAIDLFDGEAEREAEPASEAQEASPAPVQTRRRI